MRFRLGDAQDYRAFLRWHAALVPPIEDHLSREGIGTLLPDWPERRRTDALIADLHVLEAMPPLPFPVDLPAGAAALVGIAYVLEGSRLGGAVLLKQVDPALLGRATAYLGHGAGQRCWRRFVALIDALAFPPVETRAAIDAACRTFALFEAALGAFEPDERRVTP